jgi:Peptidase C13 family
MSSQDRWTHEGRGGPAWRAGTAGLLLCVLLGLWGAGLLTAGPHPAWARPGRRDAAIPFPPLHWKALLLAGDDSIGVFDHAIAALAPLFEQHHITVVQHFSASPTRLSATVHPATVAEFRAAIPRLQVQPGEGCLVYATSHGTPDGLTLARDPASGYRLRPAQLHQVVQAACGEAPTILVLSGCYTGTFLRDPLRGPYRIILTAAAADRPSFGCRPGAQYTYYDGCFLRAFPRARTWQALHQAVSRCVAAAERRLGAPPSRPQAFFGLWMADVAIPRP